MPLLHLFGKLLLFLLASVIGATLGLMWMEKSLIYFPRSEGDWDRPARSGDRLEEVPIGTSDGIQLHGWWFRVPDPRATFLYFHGNAGNLADRGDWAERISQNLGVDLLLIDYRGYGRSQGSPDEPGLCRDGEAAYRFLTETQGVSPETLVIYGVSLGGAVAADVAARFPARALILQSTFSSAPDMAAAWYPWLPVRWLVRTQFRTSEKLARMTLPKLILHSTKDEVIPVAMAHRNFQAAQDPKRLEIFSDGSGHNDLVNRQGGRILDLFREFLGIESAPTVVYPEDSRRTP